MNLILTSIIVNIIFLNYSQSSPIFWTENNDIPTDDTSISGRNIPDIQYRLPSTTYPLHYNIKLTTDVHKKVFNFTGKVIIRLKVQTDCNEIVLHSRQLNITSFMLQDENKKNLSISYAYNEKPEFSTFKLTKSSDQLKATKEYILDIDYKGILREDNAGFYRSMYMNSANQSVYLATTQFESTDARHGFPCYDEPALKANFIISINHGSEYTALSNMPAVKTTVYADKNSLTTFEETPKMSTYLVAFIVSDFVQTNTTGTNKKTIHRVYSRPDTVHEQFFALNSSVNIMDGLEKYLQVNYTLPKMDQISIPDFSAGAMENWGLVTYREELLLYNEAESTINTKTGIATTVAHEYGHQWFGNLVSPKWWTYLWLNEGFASLFAYMGSDMAYPEWNLMEYFMVAEYQRALSADAGNNPRPMTSEVQAPKDIVGLFDTVSYSKSACVLRMMQHILTDKVFAKALKQYLTVNAHNSTDENDLFVQFQKATDENSMKLPTTIKEFMETWTHQGGYPILNVTRNYKGNGEFTIEQKGFGNNLADTVNDTRLWWIPFNYATANQPNFSSTLPDHFMRPEQKVVIQQPANRKFSAKDWLILNKQNTGYYRINYDADNWKLIIEGLIKDHTKIHTYNRAQLIFDAFRFSIQNQLSYEILFNLLTYLESETSYAVWSTANTVLTYFNEYLRGDAEYKTYQIYVQNIIEKIYKKFGITDQNSDQHFDKYTRAIAVNWACTAGIENCLQNTNKRLTDLVQNNIQIEPNMQSVIYCNGLKLAKDTEFQHLYELLMKSTDQAERQLLMASLGCSTNQKQLTRFAESTIEKASTNNTLRSQEKLIILKSIYSKSEVGFNVAVKFLMEKFNEYASIPLGFSQTNPLNDAVHGLATYVINDQQKKKVEELIKEVQKHPKFDQKLIQTCDEKMKNNLDWIRSNRKIIFDWMTKKISKGSANRYLSNTIITVLLTFLIVLVL